MIKQKNREDFTSICIKRDSRKYIEKTKLRLNKSGAWAVVESFIDLIKKFKMEEELKWK